ncbi:MAG: hypothetical protein IJC48_12035 [Clostridia bacterium]|nr:hypothetical protein [Clostridia bacterium]
MAKYQRSRKSSTMFTRDPDVLPFFSIHPKTKIGTIVRVAVSLFIVFELILTLLGNNGIMFLWLIRANYLLYVVPIAGLLLLILIAIFKRMRTTFTRFAVPGIIGFLAVSVLYTFGAMMAYTNGFATSPKMILENNGQHFVFFRECAVPEGTEYKEVVNQDGSVVEMPVYAVRVPSHVFTARVPKSVEGETYEIEGEIQLPSASTVEYNILSEWTDDDSLRIYIAQDSSGVGMGEITVDFAPGETKAESPEAAEGAVYKAAYSSPDGKRDVYLYRADGYMMEEVESPLLLEENDLTQVFTVYPRTMFMFAKTNIRREGEIVVEPYGILKGVQVEWIEKDSVVRFTPTEDSEGVTGEITLYMNEKIDVKENMNAADKAAENDAAAEKHTEE